MRRSASLSLPKERRRAAPPDLGEESAEPPIAAADDVAAKLGSIKMVVHPPRSVEISAIDWMIALFAAS
jgi:hypothetical protein